MELDLLSEVLDALGAFARAEPCSMVDVRNQAAAGSRHQDQFDIGAS
jgi:hypothetical protein